ncbi:MAG: FAD:protein FMN transferase [Saprospiraceae bacterium]
MRLLSLFFLLTSVSVPPCFCAQNPASQQHGGAEPTDSLRRFEFTHPQMGTTFRLVFFAQNDSQATAAARSAFARVDTLNAVLSDYLPTSEAMLLCEKAGNGKPIHVSADLWEVLRLSTKFASETKGAFDPTIGPLTRLWRRARSLKELPDSARVEEARLLVDFTEISSWCSNPPRCGLYRGEVVRAILYARLQKPGMKLDFGGIGQGFAADECLKILRERHGIRRALADAGGDIALGDAPPGERGWRIEIPAPDSQRTTLFLKNCGITTSGATYRFFEVGGTRYSHIIDPRTGWPVTTRTLVTVQAPDATTADAWATAISVLGEKGWKKLRRRHPELQVWLTETGL